MTSNWIYLNGINKLWTFEVERSKWPKRHYHTLTSKKLCFLTAILALCCHPCWQCAGVGVRAATSTLLSNLGSFQRRDGWRQVRLCAKTAGAKGQVVARVSQGCGCVSSKPPTHYRYCRSDRGCGIPHQGFERTGGSSQARRRISQRQGSYSHCPWWLRLWLCRRRRQRSQGRGRVGGQVGGRVGGQDHDRGP